MISAGAVSEAVVRLTIHSKCDVKFNTISGGWYSRSDCGWPRDHSGGSVRALLEDAGCRTRNDDSLHATDFK